MGQDGLQQIGGTTSRRRGRPMTTPARCSSKRATASARPTCRTGSANWSVSWATTKRRGRPMRKQCNYSEAWE